MDILKLCVLLAGAIFLCACQPKVDCTNRAKYQYSLQKIAEYFAQSSPQDADNIHAFTRNVMNSGNMDMEICSFNAESVRYYVRYIGKRKFPQGENRAENMKKIRDSFNKSFGKD